MPETGMSYSQVQELLKQQAEMFKSAMLELKQMNPLEQKRFDEDMEKERRKAALIKSLGEQEEAAERAKRDRCSHMRYPAGHRMAGWDAPRGTIGGEWCTGGQVYQNGLAMTLCQRCNTTWLWKPTQEYYAIILQNGLLGAAPPSPDETICPGCFQLKKQCRCAEIHLLTKAKTAA